VTSVRALRLAAATRARQDAGVQRLNEEASGLRHLRWAREVLATLEVHYEHDARLDADEREIVLAECVELRKLVTELSAAVKPYRDFLERERTRFRGMQRVARYLVETAHGSDERADAEAVRAGFADAFVAMDKRERQPRKEALRAAVRRLRAGLDAMDARLSAKLRPEFVASLYPALANDGTCVADDEDGDDDASAPA
jgi:hypothetical protein